jgi:hypothetical protein
LKAEGGDIYTSSDASLNAKANATHVLFTCSVVNDDYFTFYWSVMLFQISPSFIVVVRQEPHKGEILFVFEIEIGVCCSRDME